MGTAGTGVCGGKEYMVDRTENFLDCSVLLVQYKCARLKILKYPLDNCIVVFYLNKDWVNM